MISADEHIFETIQLEEMERVKLMDRIDRKFWFHEEDLPGILTSILPNYYSLSIDGQNQIHYATTYFDTPGNEMLRAHHNGKLNRFKIRRRTYIDSGISFLEVKFKSNKGRTIKKRITSEADSDQFSINEKEFIESLTPFHCEELLPGLLNRFTRFTLISKAMNERCTIDTNIRFQVDDQVISLPNLVVVEIKSAGNSVISPLAITLRDHRIKQSGFSKYCVGRTIIDPTVKQNAFKAKTRRMNKLILKRAS